MYAVTATVAPGAIARAFDGLSPHQYATPVSSTDMRHVLTSTPRDGTSKALIAGMTPPNLPASPDESGHDTYERRVGGVGISVAGPVTLPWTAKNGKGVFPTPKQAAGSLSSVISKLVNPGLKKVASVATGGPSGPFILKDGPSSSAPICKSHRYRTPICTGAAPLFV